MSDMVVKGPAWKRYLGALAVLTGAVCFSGKAVLVKLVYQYDVDYSTLLAIRMGLSLPFYLVLLFFIPKQPSDLRVIDVSIVFALGILGYYLSSVFDFMGLQYVTASMERLILFIYPTIVVVLSAIFLKIKITKIQVLALTLTYSGMFIVFRDGHNAQGPDLIQGAILIFLAAFTYACYLIGTGYMIPKFGSVLYTCYVMIIAAIAVIVHFLATNPISSLDLPMQVWIYGVIMAVFATVIPSFLISEGIKMIGAGNASIIAAVGPVSTIVLAYLFLNESVSLTEGIGTILVLAGVLLVSLNSTK